MPKPVKWTIRMYRENTDSLLSVPYYAADPGLNSMAIIEIGQEIVNDYKRRIPDGWEILLILPPGVPPND